MTLNDIENIWVRRASLVLFPFLLVIGVVCASARVCWEEVLQYVPSATVGAVVLLWNPKKVHR
jgi:hypothetical protein